MSSNCSYRPVGVLEDVALGVSDGELEGEGGVVALQHGCVVVEDRQFTAGVTQEGVGPARVVHVVHRGCYQRRHLIQLVQTALNETAETQSDVSTGLHCTCTVTGQSLLVLINILLIDQSVGWRLPAYTRKRIIPVVDITSCSSTDILQQCI